MPTILCGKCGNNTPSEGSFCVSCGSPLSTRSAAPPRQPQAVIDEIHQLRELLTIVDARLDVLEGKLAAPPRDRS